MELKLERPLLFFDIESTGLNIASDYSGDELTIGFKSTFLTEILSNMSCQGLVMKFADARRAALILPSEEEAASEKICGIIMHIMIS